VLESLSADYLPVVDAIGALAALSSPAEGKPAATEEDFAAARKRLSAIMKEFPSWKEDMVEDMRKKARSLASMVLSMEHAETGEEIEPVTAEDYEEHPFGLEFLKAVFNAYAQEVATLKGKLPASSTSTPTIHAMKRASAGTGQRRARQPKDAK
jgi:hypothetical protein